MGDESVKVAVRVRPFNQREKDRKAKLIIEMNGKLTQISNPDAPKEDAKKFSFDFSYWSHDSFSTNADGVMEPDAGSNYASQRRVFEDLGQGVLDNAFQGYNCSLFAYGQTGSGKSYSMVGYGANKGIVPITCDELFKTINDNKDEGARYEITFSMLEIYNEQVKDLLAKDNPKGGLPVRQNPKQGFFYVQGLKKVPVGSYIEIEKRMEQGTANRTVASTNMNATSSRAHTVVTITFDQIIKNENGETKKSSVMNLVDLAGSERADSTGATGDRLKEGANINKSLSALGNVISALADLSLGKKKVMVPYRDSVLTKLLQNALGGNSKTIMIAALSPADINYDETLSTLRYADRAKKIKNKAVINESPMDKLIRELKEENERLKKAMESGNLAAMTGGDGVKMTEEEMARIRKELEEELRANMAAMNAESWDKRLSEARQDSDITSNKDRRLAEPHLLNLNEDPLLSGVVVHFLDKGANTIGRKDAATPPKIMLSGLSIMKEHASIRRADGGELEISPAATGAKTKVNGAPLTGPRILGHKDRILFGTNHMYICLNPILPETDIKEEITWEFAQSEIAQAKGFSTGGSSTLTKDQQIAQEQVLEILPLVSEVNAISEEINKYRSFEVVLLSGIAQEGGAFSNKSTKVMVKMKNLLNENSWLWSREVFMNRRFLMQDMYQKWLDGDGEALNVKQDDDPFWEPTEDILIGTSNLFLQSLAYTLDMEDRITITDYKGHEEGTLLVNVEPCTSNGKPLSDDAFVENPEDLLQKPYYFKTTIRSAEIHKARFSKGVRIKYKVFSDNESVETPLVAGSLQPEFNHSNVTSFASIAQEHLDWFENGCISFQVFGHQEDKVENSKLLKMSTRELRQMDHIQRPGLDRKNTAFGLDSASGSSNLKGEYMVLQKRLAHLEGKETRLKELVEEWEAKNEKDKQFEPFHRAVKALAFSTGMKLKTRVEATSEDEMECCSVTRIIRAQNRLRQNGEANGNVANGDAKMNGHGPASPDKGKVQNKDGEVKPGSRACVVQ